MTILIGHPINGIPINGLEYLLNQCGDLAKFEDVAQAKQFLLDHGFENDEIEDCFVYEEIGNDD